MQRAETSEANNTYTCLYTRKYTSSYNALAPTEQQNMLTLLTRLPCSLTTVTGRTVGKRTQTLKVDLELERRSELCGIVEHADVGDGNDRHDGWLHAVYGFQGGAGI